MERSVEPASPGAASPSGSNGGSPHWPSFDYDLFISYAHLDNEPLLEGEPGWVSDFHSILEKRLGMLLGQRPRIWRDPELRGNQYFDQTIAHGCENAALFVSILTPRYVRSDYCRKELAGFCERAGGRLQIEDRSRLVKVIKTPVALDGQPPPMDKLLGYEFYRIDPETRQLHEFRVRSPEDRERYLVSLEDLAEEIKEALELLQGPAANGATGKEDRSDQFVYVAPPSSDRKEEYELIRRELLARGYTVLPNCPLPLESEELRQVVLAALEQASLSIHIVGCRYGVVPEGTDRSLVEIQNRLAAEQSVLRPLERILWIPLGLATDDPRQQSLIESLRTDPQVLGGAALLETSLEELKAVVLDRLEQQRRTAKAAGTAPSTAPAEEGPLWIYLMHTPRDAGDVAALSDFLWDRGFEVRTPLFEGSEAEIRGEHEEHLQVCDAFLVYYGHGNERWVLKMLTDLKRARGLGRAKPILGQAICVAPPDTPEKPRLRTREAEILRTGEASGFDALTPFLESLVRR